jgi:hypothetical protein
MPISAKRCQRGAIPTRTASNRIISLLFDSVTGIKGFARSTQKEGLDLRQHRQQRLRPPLLSILRPQEDRR